MNPNVFTLNTESVSYQVAVREAGAAEDKPWRELGGGIFQEAFSIGPKETRSVQIPVDFSYLAVGSASVDLLRSKALEYRVTGNISTLTPLGRREIPFERKGLFDPRERQATTRPVRCSATDWNGQVSVHDGQAPDGRILR